jgi:hypothetical protein
MTGKIARLPAEIRTQLNRRLQNGEPAKYVVKWLNLLPEVQKLLAAEFHGKPVREQNVSEWRRHGYRAWLVHQEKQDILGEMLAEGEASEARFGETLVDRLAGWLVPNFMAEARARLAAATDPGERWATFQVLYPGFVSLRRGHHSAGRLRLDREKFELELKKFADALATAKGNPEAARSEKGTER